MRLSPSSLSFRRCTKKQRIKCVKKQRMSGSNGGFDPIIILPLSPSSHFPTVRMTHYFIPTTFSHSLCSVFSQFLCTVFFSYNTLYVSLFRLSSAPFFLSLLLSFPPFSPAFDSTLKVSSFVSLFHSNFFHIFLAFSLLPR